MSASFNDLDEMLGPHPSPDSFGSYASAEDTSTESDVPHRALTQGDDTLNETVAQIRSALIKHHASKEMIERDAQIKEDLASIGYVAPDLIINRYPTFDKTKKGNLAEIFLAECIIASSNAELPIYRLRYNPNIEQSMKGDDVLGFDFSTTPARILVGESKFRTIPTKEAVQDIVSGLIKSQQGGLPVSLCFVADRLFEEGKADLGVKVLDCSRLLAIDRLDLFYFGFLLSDHKSKSYVHKHTSDDLVNLVMISLGVSSPGNLVRDCYKDLKEEVYAHST